jgi:hypothetical protein
MAVPWLTVLRSVPWTDVIKSAPKVADGARKLWSTVAKPQAAAADAAPVVPPAPSEEGALAALEARCGSMERAIADLHAQMLASSELIKALADQNAQLVERLEVGRKRASWLVAAAALSGVVALVALAVAWFGR